MDKRQLAGIGFLIGNAALFVNGLVAHLHGSTASTRQAGVGRMASAALWSGAGLILARYGTRSVADQHARLEEKLAGFMKDEGIPLEAEAIRKADANVRRGWFGKLEDFLYDHPIECTNAYMGVASLGMVHSAVLKYRERDYVTAHANMADGALTIIGALASILIPEKIPEQIAEKGQKGTLWGKVQEKPLAFLFWPHLAADLSLGVQAMEEFKAAKALPTGDSYRPWLYTMAAASVLATVGYVAENALTGFGSKKASGEQSEHANAQHALMRSAGHMLAGKPPEVQTVLAEKAAQYLAQQEDLRMVDRSPQELAKGILSSVSAQGVAPMPVLGLHTARLQQQPENSQSVAII